MIFFPTFHSPAPSRRPCAPFSDRHAGSRADHMPNNDLPCPFSYPASPTSHTTRTSDIPSSIRISTPPGVPPLGLGYGARTARPRPNRLFLPPKTCPDRASPSTNPKPSTAIRKRPLNPGIRTPERRAKTPKKFRSGWHGLGCASSGWWRWWCYLSCCVAFGFGLFGALSRSCPAWCRFGLRWG